MLNVPTTKNNDQPVVKGRKWCLSQSCYNIFDTLQAIHHGQLDLTPGNSQPWTAEHSSGPQIYGEKDVKKMKKHHRVINPLNSTRSTIHQVNKVKVKGLGLNISYLA